MLEDNVQLGKVHLGIGRRIDSDSDSDEETSDLKDSEEDDTMSQYVSKYSRNNTPNNLEVKALDCSEDDEASNQEVINASFLDELQNVNNKP